MPYKNLFLVQFVLVVAGAPDTLTWRLVEAEDEDGARWKLEDYLERNDEGWILSGTCTIHPVIR